MATNILAAESKTAARQYHLPETDRQAMLANADNPHGKISRAKLEVIERQRASFIKKYGDEFGQSE